MTSQHSPEPWVAEYRDDVTYWITCGESRLSYARHDYAARIIKCVNACAGIPDDELHMIKIWRASHHQNLYREGG